MECKDKEVYLEVKSAVMRYNSYATYPDCLSLRGRKHVKELINHVRNGGKAIILFISALPNVNAFIPNCLVDPELCELVVEAHKVGVEMRSMGIYYNPSDSFIYLFDPDLPVVLELGKFFKKLVISGIDEFNRYRPPRTIARLVFVGKNSFDVEFSGTFCHSCGFYDYFDDFRIFLEEIGLKTKIVNIKETSNGAIVKFKVSK